jgi:hypothetical protein
MADIESKSEDFTPQEKQERFERALWAGLNMKPVHRPAKKPDAPVVDRKTTRQGAPKSGKGK